MKNKDSAKSLKRVFKVFHFIEKYIFRLLYPYKLHGNLTKYNKGSLLIIGNHYSALDILYSLRVTDRPIRFIAKQDIWDNGGLLKKLVTWAQCIPAKRDGSDVSVVKESLRVLKDDGVVCIFPEGTRNPVDGGDVLPFHSGAAALSIKTQSPIVPIVKIEKKKLFKRIDVVVGDPIEFRQYYGKKVTREELVKCDEIMREALNNMRLSFVEKHNIKVKRKKRK